MNIELVKWHDVTISPADKEDIPKYFIEDSQVVVSAGHLAYENEEVIVLIQSIAQFSILHPLRIAKSSILSRRVLAVTEIDLEL